MPDGAARDLLRASNDLVVLSVLTDGPQYGYAIIQHVAARSDRSLRFTPGVLYPLLHQMEADGLLLSSWENVQAEGRTPDQPGRRRKWYRLSARGRRRLAQRVDA
ncbi:MAG: helix-turn-helix transcriptional regulator, partial [Phycisphaerales bacterium]|nr:helix-turn-helix transcriptional regulator [Phycisphaerales bacterium]